VRTKIQRQGECFSIKALARRCGNRFASGFRASQYCAVLLIFQVVYSALAPAADTRPELELQPASLSLPVGTALQATALVVAHNRTDQPLHDLRLSWLPAASLDVQSAAPLSVAVLPSRSDYVWTLIIKPAHTPPVLGTPGVTAMARPPTSAGGPGGWAGPAGPAETRIDEELDLRLDYRTVSAGGEQSQVLLKALHVATQDPGNPDKALDVEITPMLESLSISKWGKIYVSLKNNSARTLNITAMAPLGKEDLFCYGPRGKSQDWSVPFCLISSFQPTTLGPYQSSVAEFEARVVKRLQPGQYPLAFQIWTQSYEGGVLLRRSLVVSRQVRVGAEAEAPILKVVAIPMFFVLPGALLLFTISLCWWLERRWWPAPDHEAFPLQYTHPHFWLLAVTISLLIVIVPWSFTRRWLFTRYEPQDIALLSLFSMLTGIAGYLIWRICRNHKQRQAAEKIRLLAEAEDVHLKKL